MTTTAKLAAPPLACAQRPSELLRLLDDLREGAARVLCAAFPAHEIAIVERLPGFWRFALSRARNGHDTSTLFRLAGWILALRLAGKGRECAQLLVDWLQDLVELLWGDDPTPIERLSLEEQRAEGDETALQLAYAAGDRGARHAWIEALRRERALITALIAALEREEIVEGRAAA